MHVLIAIALKSLIIAGATLGLLSVMKQRSPAERSWVAHTGLLALIVIAFAPLVLPSWSVEAPGLLGSADQQVTASVSTSEPAAAVENPLPSGVAAPVQAKAAPALVSPAAAATAAYAVPAAILLAITFLALVRLIALRARADVLVDGHWLSALARAQRRMGFKHGTALLTSNELSSPISWGLMRPVILLNNRAVDAAEEAEAIIAHELAHVARLDWVKLLLARVATALFWFNPLVWMLAREAHQLREEAADDTVLAADIPDTDYAQLLVGVARHECPGLLLGAHGVAPSRSSLARRVSRVLDSALARGPVARPFAFGVFVGAMLVAAPLAALTLTPGSPKIQPVRTADGKLITPPVRPTPPAKPSPPTDLPSIIASGVSTSVTTAMAAVDRDDVDIAETKREALLEAAQARREAIAEAHEAVAEARASAHGAAREVKVAVHDSRGRDPAIDKAIEMKAVGVSPDYISAMIAAAPQLRRNDPSDFVGMKAVGVTPDFAREWTQAGFTNIDEDELTSARAVGMRGSYVRAMMNAGVRASFDDFMQLWTVGVRPDYVQRLRSAGYTYRNADQLVEMYVTGIKPEDLRGMTGGMASARGASQLLLSVGDGITVRSRGGHFSCSDDAKCRITTSGTITLVATGPDEFHWAGCQRLVAANVCEVRVANGTTQVRVD